MVTTYTPQYSIASSSELADDHFTLANVVLPYAPGASIVAPIARRDNGLGGQLEAVVVMTGGALGYAYRDPSVTGGWGLFTFDIATAPVEVVAGYQSDGNYYLFYQDGTSLYRYKGTPSTGPICWAADATLALATNLGVAYDPAGNMAAFGLIASQGAGSLQLQYWGAGPAWAMQTVALANFNGTTTLPKLGFWTGSDWSLAVVTNAANGTTPIGYVYQGSTGGGAPTCEPVTLSNNAIQPALVTAPFPTSGGVGFFFADTANNLYCSVGGAGTVQPVLQHVAAFSGGSGFIDGDEQINLMLTDADNNLWLLQQTGAQAGVPSFTPLVPLDQNSGGCFFDSGVASFRELMGVDRNLNLKHIVGDDMISSGTVVGTIWRSYTVPQPQPQILSVPTYRSRMQVVDQYGAPARNTAVSVAVDQTVPIWWQGQCYVASPGEGGSVGLTTDGQGYVTVAMEATGLMTATLTVTCGTQALDPVAPHAPLHAFLAGTGTLNYAGGGSVAAPLQFNADTLTSATTMQSNGSPGPTLAPVLSGSGGAALAQSVTQAIQTGASFAQQAAQAARAGHPRPLHAAMQATGSTGLALDLSTSGSPTFSASADYGIFGGTVQDIGSWTDGAMNELDSLWNGIESGVADVQKFLIDLENGIAVFTAEIAGALYTFYLDIAEGIESLISTISAIFAAIEAAIEDVINWLRSLFDWQNYQNTKLNIDALIGNVAGDVEADITAVSGSLTTLISTAKTDISTFFATLDNNIGNETMQQLLSSGSSNALARHSLTGSSGTGTATSDVHGSWLLDKIQSLMNDFASWNYPGAVPDSGLQSTLTTAMANIGGDALSALEAMGNALETLFGGDYGQVTVADLLGDIETAVMDVLNALQTFLDAVIAVVTWAVAQVTDLLAMQVDIPVVSTLLNLAYTLANGSAPPAGWPATSDLLSWLLAIPCTVAYELVNGGTPPFASGPSSGVGADVGPSIWVPLTGVGVLVYAALDSIMDCMPTDDMFSSGFSIPVAVLRFVVREMAKQAYTLNTAEQAAMGLDSLLGGFNVFIGIMAWAMSATSEKSMRFLAPPGGPIAVGCIGLGQLIYLLQSSDSRDQTLPVLCLPFYNLLEVAHVTQNEYVLIGKGVVNAFISIVVLIASAQDSD